ncbi:fumarylacetoacetase [Fangia hongkongensis]|uniref:fumarylacetoacetase n=1 Tax=Fangia hongkongensis TaxID=270495 RepID=UPI0003759239|nr:fumarylacetoacetase [Fangia hongkongensis]MBK2125885.1 fumarylacetoacetase [Fangia hongkongensis]
MTRANDPTLKSFIKIDKKSDFPIQNLPFGIFSPCNQDSENNKRMGVAIGEYILDVQGAFEHKLLNIENYPNLDINAKRLNSLMTLGRKQVRSLREEISDLLNVNTATIRDNQKLFDALLFKQSNAKMHLPFEVSGYTDFYSSREHAENIGRMFRDKDNPLLPNWLHLPVAYDGRAKSVVVSGTPIKRPSGQIKPDPESPPVFSLSKALDVEVEVGTVIGTSTQFGEQISMDSAPDHIFGMVLVNDWSARDIQKWEYVPLGPFLAKNFATSISPWVVTLDALEPFRVASPKQTPEVLPYLQRKAHWGIDLQLELMIKTQKSTSFERISKTNFKYMYWDMMQQLAHHSVNGCPMNTGDLLASGTISGSQEDSFGSLIELTEGGKKPVKLKDGSQRVFLQDGDEALIHGYCENDHYRIGFGAVSGLVVENTHGVSSDEKNLEIHL